MSGPFRTPVILKELEKETRKNRSTNGLVAWNPNRSGDHERDEIRSGFIKP